MKKFDRALLVIIAVALVTIAIILIIQFKNNVPEKTENKNPSNYPIGQIPLPVNDQKIDLKDQIQSSIKTITLEDLYRQNSNISCGGVLPDEGKTYSLTGYIHNIDLVEAFHTINHENGSFRFITRNIPDGKSPQALSSDVEVVSNTNFIFNTLQQQYNSHPTQEWIPVLYTGIVKGQDLPMNGSCTRGLGIYIGALSILN